MAKITITPKHLFDDDGFSCAYFVGYRMISKEEVMVYIRDLNGYDWSLPKSGTNYNYSNKVNIKHVLKNKNGWKKTYDYLVKHGIIKEAKNG